MTFYQLFILAVIGLRVVASPRDRNALSIVLAASLVSTLSVTLFTHDITGAWKLVIPGAIELLTIAAMIRWSNNVTGYLNVGCLSVAWVAHVLCYIDLWTGGNIIYDNYEAVLFSVAVAQLASFHDTVVSLFGRVLELWTGGDSRVRAGSPAADLLRPPGTKSL